MARIRQSGRMNTGKRGAPKGRVVNRNSPAPAARQHTTSKKDEKRFHTEIEKRKQTIRFIEEEGFLPLRTKYISGDGCVRYVSRNDGTSVDEFVYYIKNEI